MIWSVSMSSPGTRTPRPLNGMDIGQRHRASSLSMPNTSRASVISPRHRSRGDHHRTHQHASGPWGCPAALEVAVRGSRAELVADELVGIHRQAHGAPGSRHSKPAGAEDLVKPFCSAACFTTCEPGTASAFTPAPPACPRRWRATSRKSERRPLVQLPMNVTSTFVPLMARRRRAACT